MTNEKRNTSTSFDGKEDILSAATVPLPGGVVLTDEETLFRQGKPPGTIARSRIVARSILRKVRHAVEQ
jgi:hypothetical protein